MTEANFELNLSVPCEARYAETLRRLAAHAARYAGCVEPEADAFGQSVQGAFDEACRQSAHDDRGGPGLPVVVRRNAGPVEVILGGRTLTIEP